MDRSSIALAHINIRSLLPKLNEVEALIKFNKFNILALSETWLNNDIDTSHINIDGYNLFRSDRGTRGGGVCFYVEKRITATIIPMPNSIEQLWLNIHFHKFKCVVGVVYRPPQLDYKTFLNDLEDSFTFCYSLSDTVICCGDFNIDLLKLEDSPTLFFNDFIDSLNVYQLVDEPTRLTEQTATLIDLMLTSNRDIIKDSGVIACDLSDHDLIFCSIFCFLPKSEPTFITYRNLGHIDTLSFQNDLITLPFYDIIRTNNIDTKVSIFNEHIIRLFDIHAPLITRRFTKQNVPWLTDNLKLLMKLRDEAKTKYRKSGSNADWNYYKALRNFTTDSFRREKKAYFEHVVANGSNK